MLVTQNVGWETRENRREVRAKITCASCRPFHSKRRCAFHLGVLNQNAGMRAPEWPVFFVVRFNKNAFVGLVLMGPTINALTTMSRIDVV